MVHSDPLWPRASEWLAGSDGQPDLVVIGVPTSAGSISPSAAWQAPAALREVLARFSTFDGETGIDLGKLTVADGGDWGVSHLDPREVLVVVGSATATLEPGAVYAFVGGDNLITWPIVAHLPHAPLDRIGVLTLDAHHDVREMPDGPINGAPIRGLVDAGLPGANVVQVGIHSFANSSAYRRWCGDRGIGVVTIDEVERRGITTVVSDALDRLAERVDAIHVDIDLDVLDRAFAPGCPGARPGGMTPRQLAAACRIAGAHPKVVSADLVEVDPTADVGQVTVMNLATALLSFAAGVARRCQEGAAT